MATPDFLITSFGGELSPSSTEDENRRKIVRSLQYIYDEYKERRRSRTDTILACWAAYLGTPQATRWQRAHSLRDVGGDMDVDWRHKINRGKAYEIVENIVPYLQGAAFPNEDWFDMVPQEPIDDPDYLMYVKIMKSYMRYKMDECRFKTNWETFLRQLCITGTSVIALPWRVETKTTKRNVKVRSYGREGIQTIEQERIIYNAPECTVEDVIDFYLDPDGLDPNNCNLVRRMVMSRGQIKRLVDEGCYDDMTETEINQMKCYKQGRSDDRVVIEDFLGIQQTASMSDSMEVFEFWGDLELNDREYKDVVCTWCGDRLLRMETNPYWAGKPFIIGTYTQVINSPYGLGALEPVLGDIHEIDVLANIRLDGETVSLMPTWLVNNDGTTDPNEIVVEPGKVIPVADINAIRPLTQDLNFVSVSIQEEQLREQTVDRRTATGSFVGTGPGRSGERVTKAEVEATREAGGNRLSGIYWHIEQTALLPCLTYVYESARQFVVEDTVIPVPGQTADELFYASVGVDQLQYLFRLQPKGATHIANKEFELRQITDWIALVGANPPMAQNINWLEVTKEVTRRFLTHQPERYIQEPQAPDPMAGASPMQQLAEQAGQMGGSEAKQAIQAAVAADGGQNMMQPYLETAPQPVVANNGQQLPI